MYYCYLLCDENNIPFYVGKGQKNRMFSHENAVKNGRLPNGCNKHLYNKIKKIKEVRYDVVFESDIEHDVLNKEIELIKKYGIDNLCNLTYGGDGLKATDEIKMKISKKLKGKKVSDSTKKLISEIQKNRFKDINERKRISELTKKAMQNEEVRDKIRKSKMGKSPSTKGKDSRKKYICCNCGDEFLSYRPQKCCSIICWNLYIKNRNIIEKECIYCKNKFVSKKHRNKIFCSNNCKFLYMKIYPISKR